MRLTTALLFLLGAAALLAQTPANTTAGELSWPMLLREARTALRTNPETAMRLCDQAIALAPTNAEPWLARSAVRDRQRAYPQAIDDASQALKLKPNLAQGWQLRGILNFKTSRFRDSVRDFDRFLELVPEQRPYHWQRGISLFYAGDYAEGARQFELHETVNADDVENDVWHFLCLARAKDISKARAAMMKPGSDPRAPMDAIYSLFSGKGTPEHVLASARSDNRSAQFYAHLYLGLYFDIHDAPAKAREHIDKAVSIAGDDYMSDVARVHQLLLRGKKG